MFLEYVQWKSSSNMHSLLLSWSGLSFCDYCFELSCEGLKKFMCLRLWAAIDWYFDYHFHGTWVKDCPPKNTIACIDAWRLNFKWNSKTLNHNKICVCFSWHSFITGSWKTLISHMSMKSQSYYKTYLDARLRWWCWNLLGWQRLCDFSSQGS